MHVKDRQTADIKIDRDYRENGEVLSKKYLACKRQTVQLAGFMAQCQLRALWKEGSRYNYCFLVELKNHYAWHSKSAWLMLRLSYCMLTTCT